MGHRVGPWRREAEETEDNAWWHPVFPQGLFTLENRAAARKLFFVVFGLGRRACRSVCFEEG